MSLRSPASILTRDSLLGLQAIKERISTLQNQIATGKRIVRTADDPAGASLVVDLQASINANKQYGKQINDALGFLQATETMTDSMNTDLTRLLELGEQGLNGTNSAANRAQLAKEVDGIRSNLINYGNQQLQGKYIFAGTQTQTRPFSGPSTGPIAYAGDSASITVDVGSSTTATMNTTGDSLFFGPGGATSATDIFQQVTDFRDGLNSNNLTQIQTAITNLRAIQDRVNAATTDLGGRQASLLQLKENLDSFTLTLQGIQNNVQDLDYPKAITEFEAASTAQQATMSTLAKANRQNLFDFLG